MTKIIAEIGWNHMGDMVLAKEMIGAAKDSGADYAKFQMFDIKRLKPGEWDQDGRREIYEKAQFSISEWEELYQYCNEINIEFLCSGFSVPDISAIFALGAGHINSIKIPSMDSRNRELLEYSTKLFDEIYMSTGTSTFEEVRESAYYIYKKINEIKNSNKHLILLHCVSCYPCQVENSNLPRIEKLKELCNSVGLSDHTEGIEVAKMALEYGIDVIEKHFTTDKTLPGRDNQFAILPEEMKELKTYITLREKANVDLGLDYQEIEKGTRENYSGRWDA